MHSLLIALLFLAPTVPVARSASSHSAPNTVQARRPITEADIEHFLNVAFGDYAAQGKRRLATWRDSARVRLREVPDSDRKMVLDILGEINQAAGRTLLYAADSGAQVEFSFVSPEAFTAMRVRSAENSTALVHSMRLSRMGNIESVRILVRNDMSPDARLAMTRLMLTKITGMMYLSMDGKPSLFHGTRMSRRLEERDKAALRLIAENAEHAGINGDEMRKVLMAKYVSGPTR